VTGSAVPDWQELLRQVTLGDLAADDPQVLAAASREPALQQALHELAAVRALLDAAARQEQEWHALVAAAPPAATSPTLVADTLARLAAVGDDAARPQPAPVLRHRWRFVMAAAALLVVGVAAWSLVRTPATVVAPIDDDDRPLGNGLGLQVEVVDGGAVLSWRGGEPLARYRVVVFDPTDPGALPALPPHETTADRWPIDATTWQHLPSGLHWRVEVVVRGEVRRRAEAPLR
jgi:hypothetical protein